MGTTATQGWIDLLKKILNHGTYTEVRGLPTIEILANQTCIDMDAPVVLLKERKLGYKFMVAEAWWILTGQNRVETIKKYSKEIGRFSDDGTYFAGAYGPKVVDQLSYIVDTLLHDPCSRQALCSIWRESPRPSRDVPCTVSAQWFIRDDKLHCVDTMRSSDAWLGWPYDIFNFSMLSAYIRELLIRRDPQYERLRLGNLWLNAGSQHIYSKDVQKVLRIFSNEKTEVFEVSKNRSVTLTVVPELECHDLVMFEPNELKVPIIDYLGIMKDYDPPQYKVPGGFLDDLFEDVYGGGRYHATGQ